MILEDDDHYVFPDTGWCPTCKGFCEKEDLVSDLLSDGPPRGVYRDDYQALLLRLEANENERRELERRKAEHDRTVVAVQRVRKHLRSWVSWRRNKWVCNLGDPFVIQFVLVTASFFVGWILRGWIQ